MELTKLLFNNLAMSGNNLRANSDSFKKTSSNFENYLSGSSKVNASTPKETIKTSSKGKNEVNQNGSKADKSCSFGKKTVKENNGTNVENKDVKDNQEDSELNAVSGGESKTDSDKKVETSDNKAEAIVSEKEEELQKEIADVLGIEVDEVKNILEQLGINVFQLKNPENLLGFLQEVFQAGDPSDLLAIEGIKDIIVEVRQLVDEKVADFESILKDLNLDFDFDSMRKPDNNTVDAGFDDNFEMEVNSEQKIIVPENKENVSVNDEKASNMEQNSVKEGMVRNENTSSRLIKESGDSYIPVDEENAEIAFVPVESAENTDMKNDFTGQGGFQNNHMNFANNSNFNNETGISTAAFENINKALSQVAVKTQSMRNVNTADVINQIIDKFKTSIVSESISEIRVTLKPDYLGDVSLKIVSENGIVSAQFTAENQRVKEIIESNFNNLKNMLDEQGVQVSALSVSVGSENSESERQKFEFEQNKSSKRINDIIGDSAEEENEEMEYVDEGDILQTNVNYTA